jgi:hypothetical protein
VRGRSRGESSGTATRVGASSPYLCHYHSFCASITLTLSVIHIPHRTNPIQTVFVLQTGEGAVPRRVERNGFASRRIVPLPVSVSRLTSLIDSVSLVHPHKRYLTRNQSSTTSLPESSAFRSFRRYLVPIALRNTQRNAVRNMSRQTCLYILIFVPSTVNRYAN